INGVSTTLVNTLAPGQTENVVISVPLTATGATVTASITASSVPDSNLSNNTSSATSTALFADVTTEVDLPASAPAGSVVTGTVVFTNSATGPTSTTASAVVGTVTLSNGQVISYPVGDLAPGASVSYSFTTTVPSTLGSVLEVTSTVATSTPESNTANNTDVDNQAGGEQLTPLFSDPGVVINPIPSGTPGSTVTTTLSLSNNGSSTTSFTTTVVINGVSTTLVNTLAPGQTESVVISVPLTATGATVTASVTASSVPDSNLSNNSSTQSAGALFADVTTEVDLPATAPAGSIVTGTVVFTNSASAGATASAVVGTVTLSNGDVISYPVGDLAPGASVTYTFTTTVPSTLGSVLEVTSTVATSTPESNTANNTDVAATGPLFADPGVEVQAIPSTVAGSSVTATVTLSNSGSATVTFTPVVVINGTTVTQAPVTLAPAETATLTVTVPMTTNGATVTALVTESTVPDSNLDNNSDTRVVQASIPNAALSGRVWLDVNGSKTYQAGIDRDLEGWTAELSKDGVVVGTGVSDNQGRYTITDLLPGTGYTLVFRNPNSNAIFSTPLNQATTLPSGNTSTGVTVPYEAGVEQRISVAGGSIGSITLYAGDNVAEQNLPIDPSGVIYDSVTRLPIAGATVTLLGPDGNRLSDSLEANGRTQLVTGADGAYDFFLLGTAPSGRYRIQVTAPAGYAAGVASLGGVAQPGLLSGPAAQGSVNGGVYTPPLASELSEVLIQANSTEPGVGTVGAGQIGGAGTHYFLAFDITVGGSLRSAEIKHNHIPLDPLATGALLVSKVGDQSAVEVGDSLRYTVRVRNTSQTAIAGVTVEDVLPTGFRFIPGTVRLGTATLADPVQLGARAWVFQLGEIASSASLELSYHVRVGVGAQLGDGTNRATAVFNGPAGPVRSNTAAFKVKVQAGVFTNQGCIVGKVYVDCNGNHVQDNVGGSQELGIPGVRLVMLDGSHVVTDSEGKYSICGVKPQTHVLKVDRSTLPKGARLLPSSNRNAGDGNSLFVDMRGGEMARADFIEGSCSVDVLDQVKARRAQGGASTPENETGADLRMWRGSEQSAQQILPALRDAPAAAVQPRRPAP
ncbi:MAG: CARDB domain-containing protein, partial [Hydrogenophaga sp.]|nr:CARDB domain-containing protein [Hydrogenophaga sp.]